MFAFSFRKVMLTIFGSDIDKFNWRFNPWPIGEECENISLIKFNLIFKKYHIIFNRAIG